MLGCQARATTPCSDKASQCDPPSKRSSNHLAVSVLLLLSMLCTALPAPQVPCTPCIVLYCVLLQSCWFHALGDCTVLRLARGARSLIGASLEKSLAGLAELHTGYVPLLLTTSIPSTLLGRHPAIFIHAFMRHQSISCVSG